jgi:glycosyltransferase involved in cell wall biosynthesis
LKNSSLSIVLPVHNAQERLTASVTAILDVLPELTSRFDLVIVDDASSDDTIEVAHELATCYPQVKAVRHAVRLGLNEAIQTGLDHTTGEIVFVGDGECDLDPDGLRKLWQLRHDEDLVLARQTDDVAPPQSTWIEKLLTWKAQAESKAMHRPSAGVQMIRRQALQELQLLEQQQFERTSRRLDRAIAAGRPKNEPGRPNYLDKVKRFALGE